MSSKWVVAAFAASLIATSINVVMMVSQASTPAHARASASISASDMLDDDDFVAGLTKMIRKTVRDYCTVGKRQGIDC